jgi:hypothetical protein
MERKFEAVYGRMIKVDRLGEICCDGGQRTVRLLSQQRACRAKRKTMQVPAILQGKRPFDLTGGIAGAILITAVGFNWTGYGFGWMLRGTAERMVINAAVAAPIGVQIDPMQNDEERKGFARCTVSRLFVGIRLNDHLRER